jgi:multimeric flavodoxin WrbA
MVKDLVILLPGKISSEFMRVIDEAVAGHQGKMITRVEDIPPLQNRKILWAVELNEYGFNLSLEEMLQAISKRGEGSLENSQGAIMIQSPVELWTKCIVHRIILQTNQLGSRYMGHPVVEATRNLVNFLTWQKQLKIPLFEIYRKNSRNLVRRLIKNNEIILENPNILVLYSNPRKTSNTMMLWQMVKNYISYDREKLVEQHVENGTIVDCRGCLYKTCKHYSERKSCFYGGIMVQEILPAIEKADYLIWLCPNYNDAVSAKLMAVINRLTVLYKRVNFYQKSFFAIIVSGNSGNENVAMQLIGALNVNKGLKLPPYFSLMAIANDPGAVKKITNIQKKARDFAQNICKEVDIQFDIP